MTKIPMNFATLKCFGANCYIMQIFGPLTPYFAIVICPTSLVWFLNIYLTKTVLFLPFSGVGVVGKIQNVIHEIWHPHFDPHKWQSLAIKKKLKKF